MLSAMTSEHRSGAPDARPWAAPLASGPVNATVRMPGTKSGTNRYLVLAALSTRSVRIARPLWARDTHLMVDGLRSLGVTVDLEPDFDGEMDAVVTGPHAGGRIGDPRARVVNCGNAGTVARFLPPFAALTYAPADFDGDPRIRERPLTALLDALRALGAEISAGATAMPFTIRGPLTGGPVVIDASASSQLVSGLLLSGPGMVKGVSVRHVGPTMPSQPHVRMTVAALREAGAAVDTEGPDSWTVQPGDLALPDVVVEPDLSTASAFLAAAAATGGTVTLADWPLVTEQPGAMTPQVLRAMGCTVTLGSDGLTVTGPSTLTGVDVDLRDNPEVAPTITALAVLADSPTRLRGIAHIRGQETDRLAALSEELGHLGASIAVEEDGLTITPASLKAPTGVVLDPRADHRLAMAYAVVGLRIPGVAVSDIATTGKTISDFPARWAMLVDSA